MKTPKNSINILRSSIASLIALGAIHHHAHAQDILWIGAVNNVANGAWGTAANWTGSNIPDTNAERADFRKDWTGSAPTFALQANRTVNGVYYGDTGASGDITGSIVAGSTLTLAGTTPFVLTDNSFTINSTTAWGATAWAKQGAQTLTLTAANTGTGAITVSAGTLQLNNATAAGTAAITVGGRVTVNGGVTIANAISVNSGASPGAGLGAVQSVGTTGQGRVNGLITINGAVATGGHLVGGAAVGNELVIGGGINVTAGGTLTQREGRVIYNTAATGFTTMTTTGAVILGANDVLPAAVALAITNTAGGSAGSLQLNNFNQTIGSLNIFGGSQGSVTTGSGVLTLNGGLTSSLNFTHTVDGNINLGGGTRTFTINDGTNAVDLVAGAAFSNGTISKAGAGTLTLNGTSTADVTVTAGALGGTGSVGGLTVDAGGVLHPATLTTNGTLTSSSLTFGAGATTVLMDAGAGGDLLATGALATNGTATLNVNQFGGMLAPSATPYNLITYTGAGPGTGGFVLAPIGHATASLVDTGTSIAVLVSANDRVVWDGTNTTAWATGATGNWITQVGLAATDYIEGDDVVFQDLPTNSNVVIGANVTPSNVAFTNTNATTYNVTGAGGIGGTTALTKTGNGTVVLATPNTYSGATTISGGTLELDHDAAGAVVLSGTSGVSVAAGATLALTRNDGDFTFSRNISGAGTLDINPTTAGTAARGVTLSGTNTGFSGNIRLLAPVGGTYRLTSVAPTALGTATIDVASGAQIYTANGQTYTNSITNLVGIGYNDGATLGSLGALRLEGGSNWAGSIVIDAAGARINAHNATGTVSGNISGGPLEVNASTGFANTVAGTVIFTGTNTYSTTLVGGSTSGTVASRRLNIGANGTTGTLGTGAVSLDTTGHNAVIGFDRADGYTLGAGNTITAVGSTLTRSFVDLDTLGAGFSDNGVAINLGGSLATTGGQIRVAQGRAGAIANFSGSTTAGQLLLGAQAGFGNGTVNLNSGAAMNVGTVRVSTAALNTSTINVNNGATLTAFSVGLGEVSGGTGVLNQVADSTVNIDRQLRVGHFPNNTSTYNMNGGTLTMTGVSPDLTPSTAGGGAANTTGDNNINALATPEVVGGGIYIGIDGQGTFNHTAGTVTTNWIVLDNRAASGAGANMVDGLDRYSLSGTGELRLRSNWGFIGRNEASYLATFGGGSVVVDNTGTGTGTGANITIPLDATIDTVAATTTTLDTNGAGNGFTLTKDVRGTGTLSLIGGGTVNLSTAAAQTITAAFTGSVGLNKTGTGATTLGGNLSGYTGNVNVSAGVLTVPTNLGAGTITVADNAAINGEPILVTALNLGSATGSTIYFDPNTVGAFTTGTLTVAGVNNIDLAAIPAGVGPYTVISYGSKLGAGTFQAANPTSYRVAPVIDDTTGNMVTINYTGQKNLTWTGSASTAWDINNAINWNDTAPAPDVFFNLDTVTFPEGGANPGIALTGNLAPAAINVTSATTNYTFTSTAGNQIIGATGINKTGASTLTLVGPNTHFGVTSVGGGILSVAAADSLGAGVPGNSIALSSGGRLTLTAAMNLGANRSIAVGAGGGNVTMANAAAQTISIPGNISGSGALALESTLAGGGTFALFGNNSGYSGAISVNAISTGLSSLRLENQQAIPTSGSITLNFPAAGATGSATNLTLIGNLNLPVGTTLNFTSSQATAAISLRSGMTTVANSTSVFNGPITLSGSSIVQFNAAAGATMTYNAPITESAPGAFAEAINSFSNVFFLRGTGTHIVNNTITLPSAGSTVAVTDGATAILNVAGNDYRSANSVFGTLRLGVNDALPTTARLVIGQAGDQATTFDLNGFNQTVSGLEWQAPTGNLLTKGISNSHPTNTSTFTLNQATAPLANFNGTISGRVNFVKDGVATTTLVAPASNFTGNVTVNAGTLAVTGFGAAAGGNGTLGAANVVGKTITVNSTATLSFGTNNIFGNGVANANLPAVIIDGGTLTSTRYNVLGPITLNGATLTQSATDGPGSYEGYQFRGNVTVGGSAASTISTGNGKANHLNAITTFNVANATGDANADLTVSAPLRNQSGDFALASGSLTKNGAGTMALTAVNTFTGGVTIDDGTLNVNADAALGAVAGAVAINNNAILQASGAVTTAARTVTLGVGGATIDTNGNRVNLNAGSTVTGTTLTKTGLGKLVLAGTQSYSTLDTEDGRTDLASALGTGTSSIIANAETNSSVSQTLDSLIIGDGAVFTLGAPLPPAPFAAGENPGFAADFGGELAGAPVQGVPEPGSATLLFGGILTILGLRRRR